MSVIGTRGPSGSFNTANLVIQFNKEQSQCHVSETTEYCSPVEMKVQVILPGDILRMQMELEWVVGRKGPNQRSCGQYEDCSNQLLLQLSEITIKEAPSIRCQQASYGHRNLRVCYFLGLES